MKGLLIVDDEEGVRRSLKRALEREDYVITLAENGRGAIEIVKERLEEISICISDLKMPGLDGLETLVVIGEINPEITRIILTGYATMESAILATNEGIDGFLTKPFENRELRAKIREYFLKKRLKQFVSAEILRELEKNPSEIYPQKRKVTILFTDIRGFSSLAEEMDPQELASLMNSYYFTPLSEVIFKYKGTLDKHIGDSIMALYGAPISYGDDAYRAIISAVEIRDKIREINRNLNPLKIPVGIGINTGEVVTGIFGSIRKKEYTAFGSTVNIAANLQKIAQADQILITEDTYLEVWEKVEVERADPLRIKGTKKALPIYNVLGLK